MADETNAAGAGKEHALELFTKVRKLAEEIMQYQMKQKEKKFEFYDEIGGHIRQLGQDHTSVLAFNVLPGSGMPKEWLVFDLPGNDSITGKIVKKYVDIKNENPEFGSLTTEAANALLNKVHEIGGQEVTQEVEGIDMDVLYLQHIIQDRDFILKNSDTGKANDRIGEFLEVVSKSISNAKMYSVWHRLIAGTDEPKFIKKDFPEPFSVRNFLVAEKVRLQCELMRKTEAGRAILDKKLDELKQAGSESDTLLGQILQGKDVYMKAIQAAQNGREFKLLGDLDETEGGGTLESFLYVNFGDKVVQEQLAEVRPKRIKAEPARAQSAETSEKSIEAKDTESETDTENPEKRRWPMK